MKLCSDCRGLFLPFLHVCFGGASSNMAASEENLFRDHASNSGPDK